MRFNLHERFGALNSKPVFDAFHAGANALKHDVVINGNDGTGVNIIQENLVGNAPGSEASGTGNNLSISNLKGNMNNSVNNSYSINMADYADGITNPANSGRSTDIPS